MAALEEITAMLAKKGTFLQAVQRLTEEVNATYGSSAEGERLALFTSAKRAYTLLCSRYTAVGFWRVGRELFSAIHAACRLACHPSLRHAIPDLPSLPTPPPSALPGCSLLVVFAATTDGVERPRTEEAPILEASTPASA
jgi:hypothetical protein